MLLRSLCKSKPFQTLNILRRATRCQRAYSHSPRRGSSEPPLVDLQDLDEVLLTDLLPEQFEDPHTRPTSMNPHGNHFYKSLIGRLAFVSGLSSLPDMRVAYERLADARRTHSSSSFDEFSLSVVGSTLSLMEALDRLGLHESLELKAVVRLDLTGIWYRSLQKLFQESRVPVILQFVSRLCRQGEHELIVDLLEGAASLNRGSGRLHPCHHHFLWTRCLMSFIHTRKPSAEQITSIIQRMVICGVRGRAGLYRVALSALVAMRPVPTPHITECFAVMHRYHVKRGSAILATELSWLLQTNVKTFRARQNELCRLYETLSQRSSHNAKISGEVHDALALYEAMHGRKEAAWSSLQRLRMDGGIPIPDTVTTTLSIPMEHQHLATELKTLEDMVTSAPSAVTLMWAGIWRLLYQEDLPMEKRITRATMVYQAAVRHTIDLQERLSLAWPIILAHIYSILDGKTTPGNRHVEAAIALYQSIYSDVTQDEKSARMSFGPSHSWLERRVFIWLLRRVMLVGRVGDVVRLCLHARQRGFPLLDRRVMRPLTFAVSELASDEQEATSAMAALLLVGECTANSIADCLSAKRFPTAPHVASPTFIIELHQRDRSKPVHSNWVEELSEVRSYRRLLERYHKFISADLGLAPNKVRFHSDDPTINAISKYIRQIHTRLRTLADNGFASLGTQAALLYAYSAINETSEARQVLKDSFKIKVKFLDIDDHGWSKFASVALDFYVLAHDAHEVGNVWEEVREKCPKLSSRAWASYLECLCRTGQREKAVDILCTTMGDNGDATANVPKATAEIARAIVYTPDAARGLVLADLKRIKTQLPNLYEELKMSNRTSHQLMEEFHILDGLDATGSGSVGYLPEQLPPSTAF